jgi:hypothetical protein
LENRPLPIRFERLYEWAIAPQKRLSNVGEISTAIRATQESFEYYRSNRSAELCWSWRKANIAGWNVLSPINAYMTPFEDFELSASMDQDQLRRFSSATNFSQIWTRQDSRIAVRGGDWMRAYDFRVRDNSLSMFIPNGAGTAEWVLGWTANIPEGFVLLFLPLELRGGAAEILAGALRKKSLDEMADRGIGASIAIRVKAPFRVSRGDVIGRFLILPEYCLDLVETEMRPD